MFKIKRKDLSKLHEVCKEVGDHVKIPLEVQECKKIVVRNVNNYINIIDDSNIKFKGMFEIDRDFHKNHSKRIVPLALAEYFINGVKPDDYIKNYLDNKSTSIVKEYDYSTNQPVFYTHHNIYDFCIGSKMKGSNKLYERHKLTQLDFDELTFEEKEQFVKENGYIEMAFDTYCDSSKHELIGVDLNTAVQRIAIKNRFLLDKPLNKTNRYIVTTKDQGYSLIKKLPPLDTSKRDKLNKVENQMSIFDIIPDEFIIEVDRESEIEAGYNSILLNRIDDDIIDDIKNNNRINYDYYIDECYKVINEIK